MMNTAIVTVAIGWVVRLVVPFTVLILLTNSLNWAARLMNGGRKL